ncbi:CRABP1 isoform 3, partial [Pan troglodytes]
DELLKALGVNAMLRKVAVAAASKPHVEIRQDGDQFYIKTSTTVRTTEINFKVGEGFEEETVDGRKCRVRPQSHYSVPGSPLGAHGPLLLEKPMSPFAACGALSLQEFSHLGE